MSAHGRAVVRYIDLLEHWQANEEHRIELELRPEVAAEAENWQQAMERRALAEWHLGRLRELAGRSAS
jgi:hypothetical protein